MKKSLGFEEKNDIESREKTEDEKYRASLSWSTAILSVNVRFVLFSLYI